MKTLSFYSTPGSNGKLSPAVYHEQVLEGPVKEWIGGEHELTLKEDRCGAWAY
jgi:hypothetical protein